MITTQKQLDELPAGVGADVGPSENWLYAREGFTVNAREGSTVYAWEGFTVNAREGSTVYAWAGSTVNAREGSTVNARRGSTVYAREGSTVEDNGGCIIRVDRSEEQTAFNKHVAQSILADPTKFDMEEWYCGTSMCWAGWAVHLSEDGQSLKDELTYPGAGAYLCGPEMMRHFYRQSETAGMFKFAEVIAAGGTIADADKASRESVS